MITKCLPFRKKVSSTSDASIHFPSTHLQSSYLHSPLRVRTCQSQYQLISILSSSLPFIVNRLPISIIIIPLRKNDPDFHSRESRNIIETYKTKSSLLCPESAVSQSLSESDSCFSPSLTSGKQKASHQALHMAAVITVETLR